MLVWRKGNIEKNCLCYSSVYYYNGAHWYEQFLQVGRLYRALILLGLALCLPNASMSSLFMVLYICDAFLPNEAYVADSKVEQQAFICVKGVVW